MNKTSRLLGGALLLLPLFAQAGEDGNMMFRVRALNVSPQVGTSGALSGMGLTVPSNQILEGDISYFVTRHVAVEVPFGADSIEVRSNGNSLGKVSAAPAMAIVQYHFMPDSPRVRPYVGLGAAYTFFYRNGLHAGPAPINVQGHDTGLVFNLGMDVPVGKNQFINASLTKLQIKTDVNSPALGGDLGTLKLNPLLAGVGYGWRF